MYERPACPECGKLLVSPAGVAASQILLVGEFPGVEEIKSGIPFVGPTGEILQAELNRIGIQIRSCRLTNLWLHQKDDKDCTVDYHVERLLQEIKGRSFILLMGSDTIKTLCGTNVMSVSGLRVTSPYIPETAVAVAAPNPAAVMRGVVGEFRLALKNFKEYIDVPHN